MTPERLRQIIESHGAGAARWPADERASALSLAARDPEITSSLDAARALDAALASADIPELPASTAARLTRSIIAAARTDGAAQQFSARPGRVTSAWRNAVLRPALAAAATLVLGFSLGFSGLLTPASSDDDDTLAMEVGMATFTTATSAESWLDTTAAPVEQRGTH